MPFRGNAALRAVGGQCVDGFFALAGGAFAGPIDGSAVVSTQFVDAFGCGILVLLALPSTNYLNHPHLLRDLPVYLRLPEGGFQQPMFCQFPCQHGDLGLGHAPACGTQRQLARLCVCAGGICCRLGRYLSSSRTGSVGMTVCVGLLLAYAVSKRWFRPGVFVPAAAVLIALCFDLHPFRGRDRSYRVFG